MRLRDTSLALAMALTPIGCGAPEAPSCVPGAQVECACPGGDPGIQICASDGLSLGPCVCGGGAGGSGGEGAQGGEDPGGAGPGGAGPGGGGNGGSGPCAPGDEESCYDGPGNTEDVGICSPGTRLCDVTGAWGACMGQQLPLSEDCQTEADENCDGATPACGAGFVKTLGDGSTVVSVAFDQDGNHVILGTFDGTIDFGGGNTLTDIGPYDVFIAKLDPSGNHLWSHAIGDPITTVYASPFNGLAVDSTGAVYAALGFLGGDVTVFGEDIDNEGEHDGLLLKIDADGTPVRVLHYGSAMSEYVESTAVDADDNLVFTMAHAAPIYFGGPEVLNSGRALVKLDADGNHVFSRTTLPLSGGSARVAMDPVTDAIFLMCHNDQVVDLGLGPISPAMDGRLFLGFFDPLDGSPISYGATGGPQIYIGSGDTVIAPNGDIIISGSGSAAVFDFGQPNPTYHQAFVARLTPDLQPVFVRGFTAFPENGMFSANFGLGEVALDSVGDVTIFGWIGGAPNSSGQVGPTNVVDSSFMFQMDDQGTISDVQVYGPPASVTGFALERAPDGVLTMGGLTYGGTFDLGGQTLSTPIGIGQGFLVRMAPN